MGNGGRWRARQQTARKTWRTGRAKMAELIKLKEIREFTVIGHVHNYRGCKIECGAGCVCRLF